MILNGLVNVSYEEKNRHNFHYEKYNSLGENNEKLNKTSIILNKLHVFYGEKKNTILKQV